MARDGVTIFTAKWQPSSGEVKAIVHIAHGMSEHCLRYDRLASSLASAGYIVYSHDHRGHGRTIPYGLGHATPTPSDSNTQTDGFADIVLDLKELIDAEKSAHPGLGMMLLGHSLGTVVAQKYAGRFGDSLSGLVLSGPPVRPPAVLSAGIPLLFTLLTAKEGNNGTSNLIRKITFDEFNKQFTPNRTGSDWLSSDEGEVDAYEKDPLCGFDCSVGFWRDFLGALISLKDPSSHAALPSLLPTLIMAGDRDPCTENSKALIQIREELKESQKMPPKVIIYPAKRHEIFNEVNREEVTEDLICWLNRSSSSFISSSI